MSTEPPGINRYLRTLDNLPKGLTPDREIELMRKSKKLSRRTTNERRKKGDHLRQMNDAERILVQGNLCFAISVAKEYQGQGLPLDDLISWANMGLIKAAQRFDETRGFKFISYAVWWIRQSILQALADHARVVDLPLNRIGDKNRVERAAERLEQRLGRTATRDEIADEVNKRKGSKQYIEMDGKQVGDIFLQFAVTRSLDAPLGEHAESTLHDVLPGNTFPKPGENLDQQSLVEEVSMILDTLKPREAEIIRLHFGIGKERSLTLDEIGVAFHLTRERVRQIKEKALNRLRHNSRKEPLRKYLA